MAENQFVLFDTNGEKYQPVRTSNLITGITAYRVKPPGASNTANDAIELDSIEGVARAMLVEKLPARIQAISGGQVNYLKFGGQKLVGYKLDPEIAARIGVPARSGAPTAIAIDQQALEKLRQYFETLHPDMTTFAACESFAKSEGDYKYALIAKAKDIMQEFQHADNVALGQALLNLVSKNPDSKSQLIEWQSMEAITKATVADRAIVETAIGTMVRDGAGSDQIMTCADAIWPIIAPAGIKSKPYALSRMATTLIAALVNPTEILGIRSTPTNNAHKLLYGVNAFTDSPLSRPQLDKVLSMARHIFTVMQDEWGWQPRDLWDVQGFIWETCQKGEASPAPTPETVETPAKSETQMPDPTNLILYGPPGTGKTYRTALEAVRLCNGAADYADTPDGRKALMKHYRELQAQGRIGFVTFHQNFSYEDFVEGLRPVTQSGEDDAPGAGFSLKPQDGVFKQIAQRAETPPITHDDHAIDITKLNVFKMSLGANYDPKADFVYPESIGSGYALLGFKNIDWSPEEYGDKDAILETLQRQFPEEGITASKGVVSSTHRFRNLVKIGDLLLVSSGISKIRAIGIVTGEYEYAPRPDGTYCHRRAVDWLWDDPEGVDVSEIYGTAFMMQTIYQLNDDLINRPAIAKLIASTSPKSVPAAPEPHVLIIDEINRANVSKVFGELITLIEPDKRAGMTNALTVTLPYSKKSFGVPANLHIIGTMNTADRSIALLDTALRRRFTFEEIAPDPSLLKTVGGIDLQAVLKTINERIEYLIDREHRIGHAFFMPCDNKTKIDGVMRDKVIPLLQEYFFEDWKQIWSVLGDGFIQERKISPPPGFSTAENRSSWSVRKPFSDDAYTKLINGKPTDQPDDTAPSANEDNEATGESE